FSSYGYTFSTDSVGIEEVNGKKFILHKVEMNETLYSVSRKYNVPINKIIASNPPTEYGLDIGQIIKIPLKQKKEKVKQMPVSVETSESTPENNANQTIKHQVAPKQTLYSISKQYGVNVQDLKQWNNLQSNSIDIGQVLIIKKSNSQTEEKSEAPVYQNNAAHKTHIVKQSETLYSLSRQYGASIEDLLKWNDLSSPDIGIGQELIVGVKDNPAQIADGGDLKKSEKQDSTKLVSSTPQISDSISTTPEPKKERMEPVTKTGDFEEIIESGVATLIDGSDGNRKYLALHRTAKVGTILRVRNEMNDQEVFVRVLGKLPDTGVNKNVVIRISKSAYERLGAIDPQFRVTVSYIP
ncbi:LysM peptidoglycan-binding domain-containing protein, partial [Fulvivirga sp. RKSG066]|uniref:LysM peptidoglycan-binding domain-containing protein n=1 Tax=Fulvivirga aurantia TaxID=2529383 RepID=UPI0012BD8242